MKQSFEDFLIKLGTQEGEKFNSCHSPGSGQFCSTGGGGGIGGQLQASDSADSSKDENAYKILGVASGTGKSPLEEVTSAKNTAVSSLSQETGLEYEEVNNAVMNWGATSNDNHYGSLTMQKSAADLFGIEMNQWQKDKLAKVEAMPVTYRNQKGQVPWKKLSPDEGNKLVLQAMYNKTQDDIKAQRITHVTLYRGADLKPDVPKKIGSTVKLETNPLESWTSDPSIAKGHGNTTFKAIIPVDRILSTARTGFGSFNEREFVIIGGKGDSVSIVR